MLKCIYINTSDDITDKLYSSAIAYMTNFARGIAVSTFASISTFARCRSLLNITSPHFCLVIYGFRPDVDQNLMVWSR